MLRISALIALLLCLLTGCTMITSYNNSLLSDGGSPRQGAGAYHLPKHILVATVTQLPATKGKRLPPPNIALVRKAIADPHYPMNVGFDLSPTSDDDIKINYSQGLLQKITASADDKSRDIIEHLTKSIFGSFNRVAGTDGTGDFDIDFGAKVVQVSFDPFDHYDHDRANAELGRHGFCIAFASDSRSSATEGCPQRIWSGEKRVVVHANGRARALNAPETGSGLFFRQPIEHKIQVFQLDGPRCRGWCLRWEGFAAFANAGPLLRVNVDRTIFVKRVTTVTFGSDGVPSEVQVVKPSEALVAAQIPLIVTKAILAAPGEAIASSTTTLVAQKGHVDAQKNLLTAQTDYIDTLNARLKKGEPIPEGHGLPFGTPVVRSADSSQRSADEETLQRRRRQFFQNCADIGLDRGGCETEWTKVNS